MPEFDKQLKSRMHDLKLQGFADMGKTTTTKPNEPKQCDIHVVSGSADLQDELCNKCKCCDTEFVECYNCGGEGGTSGEELMMEDPMWYDENSFRTCDICDGKGGWSKCLGNCDENGKHCH